CSSNHRFEQNSHAGLADRRVDGGERSVLQIAVGGVVAGEVAESVAAADDDGRGCREGEADTRSDVAVLSGDVYCIADTVHASYLQCRAHVSSCGCKRLRVIEVRNSIVRFGEGSEDVIANAQ